MKFLKSDKTRKAAAALLCLCMVLSLCDALIVPRAMADAGNPVLRAAEHTENIVDDTRVADPNTMDDYVNRLLSTEYGSRYAGRVWTDKTVFAFDAGEEDGENVGSVKDNKIPLDMDTDGYNGSVGFKSDFAHVFSALASSQVINEYPPSPVDLVIVFDMSGSMGQDTRYSIDPGYSVYQPHVENEDDDDSDTPWPDVGVPMADRIKNSRIQKTLDAINNTIDKLMAQNPQNRVAVCGYGANAVVLMPLGHYQHADMNNDGKPDEGVPYLSVGGMETLYHPSDLVYRSPDDGLKMGEKALPAVEAGKEGWYWMNNRDTCYTVVVNAQYNTYTGILDEDGDAPNSVTGETYHWKPIEKTVSNNVLSDDGNPVKAFPGAWNTDGTPANTHKDISKEVYEGSSSGKEEWAVGANGVVWWMTQPEHSGEKTSLIKNTMNPTCGLKADDYVGYFTNTQGGIYLAYKQLADSTATTYTEELSNGVVSTVARIPAAIIMSDGGANFSFNEMGEDGTDFTVNDWNGRYGRRTGNGSGLAYITDDTVNWDDYTNPPFKGFHLDLYHRLNQNTGDEWYKVYLPGNDTLDHDGTSADGIKGYWDGLHGIYNQGADIYEDGTLSTPPIWDQPGIFYSSDNDVTGTAGTVMEVLLTASYMSDVVETHYSNGWTKDNATEESKSELFTYTMNVDTKHVPLWGKMRLYPTLDPKDYNLNSIDDWYDVEANNDKFGTNQEIQDTLYYGDPVKSKITKEVIFKGANIDGTESKTYTIKGLKAAWEEFKEKKRTNGPNQINENGAPVEIAIEPIPAGGVTYEAGGKDNITVTNDDVVNNIAYNDAFYDVTSEALDETFQTILAEILGNVFVPISGDNDAGVGDSITYQDPLGEYMEIKDGSIIATPHHIDDDTIGADGPQTYDMSLLVFGEMHGLVRVGVYDYQWNDKYMQEHPDEGKHGEKPFPQGWYRGDDPAKAEKAQYTNTDATGSYPTQNNDGTKFYNNANEARADGWVFRVNFETLLQFVPIVDAPENNLPENLSPQVMNTKYTLYRFAGTQEDRNELRRNPIYGEGVPQELTKAWNDYYNLHKSYPVDMETALGDTSSYPGLYRLSDIRVWVEDTGDFTDTTGAIAPNQGYDRSLYLNIPVAAVPTELATITMGKDGVMAYQTNLGSDHPKGTNIGKENEVTYQEYCYQSTPFRLFYAVGLEDDLILRDAGGAQVGVDLNSISPEYIQAHTAANGNVWFISNYYSDTRYGEYTTDGTSRTRGDPTVTFSPGADNRYYVFQKPLPLYAHAYRVSADYTGAVDFKTAEGTDFTWDNPDVNFTNGKTTWEDGNEGGASWQGGQFMGVYSTREEFRKAYTKAVEDGEGKITDSHGTVYKLVDDGIIFSEEDLLDHVTSIEGGGYTDESHSFSSDDYYFILLEFYRPLKGTEGKDKDGKPIAGATGGEFVQWALARKGSEFGSGYASSNIKNGDMLCWTDMKGDIDANFAYMSTTDTGDRTRGEPTWEKLTLRDEALRKYLTETCGIDPDKKIPNPAYVDDTTTPGVEKEISVLDEQETYWETMQEDAQVKAALDAADTDEDHKVDADEFNKYFQFALATRPGGIRSGDMSNNLQYKSGDYVGGYFSNNVTKTSNTYYLPTISDNSGTDDNVIINNFLGNNGRLEIANQTLHVTKMIEPPKGYTLTDAQKNEVFNFQVSIQGVTGTRSAVKTEYNEYAGSWERELAYIDVLTDNSDLVQTNNSTRALFVLETTPSTLPDKTVPIAKQVIQGDDGYYYADDDGNITTTKVVTESLELYYMYLPANGATGTDGSHVHRLYQNEGYTGTDKGDFTGLEANGTTTFVNEDQHEFTGTGSGAENRDSYRQANNQRPTGTKTYWAQNAELIPKDEVDDAEASSISTIDPGATSAIATIALEAENGGGTWTHEEYVAQHDEYHKELTFHTFVIRKPSDATDSTTNFSSPYKTRTQYMTVTLEFGKNANEKDGSGTPGEALVEADLYDLGTFGTVGNTARLLQITAEFTLKHGEGLMFSGLSGSDYKFVEQLTEEQIAKGYTLKQIQHVQQNSNNTYEDGRTSVNGDTGNGEEQAHYTNTFEPAPISITKNLEAQEGTELTDADRATEFDFTLKIDVVDGTAVGKPDGVYSYTITGEKGETVKTGRLLPHDVPEDLDPTQDENDLQAKEDGTWDFTLKGGQTMKVNGLAINSTYTYTVTEISIDEGYTVTDSDTGEGSNKTDKTITGTVKPGINSAALAFTNTKKEPEPVSIELPLTKTVTGSGFTWDDETFTFLVTPDESNPEGDPLTETKVVTVDKPDDGSNTNKVDNIFDGVTFEKAGTFVYTVTEKVSDIPGISSDGKTYTVKVVVSEDYGEDPDHPIYTGKLKAVVTVTPDESITFDNPYNEDKIDLPFRARKVLEGGVLTNEEFTFELECTGFTSDGEISLVNLPVHLGTKVQQYNDANGYVDFGSLTFTETGTYTFTIRELSGTDPKVEYDGKVYTVTVKIVRDAITNILKLESIEYESEVGMAEFNFPTFINKVKPGNLAVYKKVTGEGDTDKDFNFTVTFEPNEGLNDAEIKKYGVDDLETSDTFSIDGDGKLEFTLKHGEHLEVKNLPGGTTYTVTEAEANQDGYTTTVTDNDSTEDEGTEKDGKGTIEAGETDVVEFTNDKPAPKTGSLTVTKTVSGEGGDKNKAFNFTVTLSDTSINGQYGDMTFTNGVAKFTLKDGDSKTAEGLPEGVTYTVSEEATDGYTTTYEGASGTIADGVTAKAEFTNTFKTGNLSVSKTVTGDGDKTKEFHFTVTLSDSSITGTYGGMTFTNGVATFTLKHGESVTATGLPAGITYSVTETEANSDGYNTTIKDNDDVTEDGKGTIEENKTDEVAFTNDKPTTPPPGKGNLIVSKTVTGTAGDKTKEWHFRVELSDKTISGEYGGMTFTEGVATFTLKDGETKTAEGLPAGTSYSVTETEADQDGYTTTPKEATGTIPEGGTTEVTFVNNKDKQEPDKGNLTVTKTVTNSGDKSKEWHFRVELSDTTITGTYGDMTFTNGVAEFTLKHGESKTASGLPAGVTYTVTEEEANADGYTTEATDATGTIPDGGTATAKFVNDKDNPPPPPPPPETPKGDLDVHKTVTRGDRDREWHFRVELSQPLTGWYGDMYFQNGVAEFTLRDGETKHASGLPEGVTYTVTEIEANQDGYTTGFSGASGTVTANATAHAGFVNDKPDEPHKPDKPNEPDKPHDETPETGDNSKLGLWLAAAVISFIGMVVTGLMLVSNKRLISARGRHVRK